MTTTPANIIGSTAGPFVNLAQCPAATNAITGAGLQVGYQSMCDNIAYICAGNTTFTGIKTFTSAPVLAAGAHVSQAQALTADGTGATLAGTWAVSGNVSFSGGSVQVHEDTSFASDSRVFLVGRVIPRSARIPVTAANCTLGVAAGAGVAFAGKRFAMATNLAAASLPIVVLLKSTGVVPSEGETMECIAPALVGAAPGIAYSFRLEDGTTLVAEWVISSTTAVFPYFTEFEFVSGVWRLGASSGSAWDGADDYGVIPRTGA